MHDTHHHTPTAIHAIFILENLNCAHCASKMESRIRALPNVEEASITFSTKQLRLTAADPFSLLPEIRHICTSIEADVQVLDPSHSCGCEHHHHSHNDSCGCGCHHHEHPHEHDSKKAHSEKKEGLFILLGAALFVAGIFLKSLGIRNFAPLLLFVAAYLTLGSQILLSAAKNILHGQVFDENFLMGIATLGAFAIQEYPEAVGVMLFYRIGEFFEHKAVERSRSQIMAAIDMRPETVTLFQNHTTQIIPAPDAQVGDLLLIRPGDRIPLDGKVLVGKSRLDTSPITGEPIPTAVGPGDHIFSGCVNISGQLTLQVEKTLSESMVSRILHSVENAAASKPKIDRFISRFSRIYTPCVVFLALGVAILPSIFTGDWNYWIYTALTFLVMSCPCALVLSVPLAFFSGIGAGSKRGILFKGGATMEALNKIRAVVVDKTGTLTQGNFQLQEIITTPAFSQEELLRICASCEQNSSHPIAHSIVAAARKQNLTLETPAALEEISGHGITARLDIGNILCGNRKLMERYQITLPEMPKTAYGSEVFIAIDRTFAGHLRISDTLKADAKTAIRRLKSSGLHTVMLTGDSETSAKAVAEITGIDEVHARLLPEEKLSHVQKIRRQHGAVLFVGDGINDAPVLAGADVGAAMGSGADAAIEAADVVFMTSGASSIPEAVSIARRACRIAAQNVVFALTVKIGTMILGLLGFANMWLAVFADSGVALLCVLNAVRALYQKQ